MAVSAVAAVQLIDGPEEAPDPPVTSTSGPTGSTDRATTSTPVPTTTTTTVDPSALAPTDRFTSATGQSVAVGTGPLRTYVVEVEDGIPIDAVAFAMAVDATLADPRGWTAPGDVSLQRVGPGDGPSFRVRLATPATVDAHCAPLQTNGIFSCRQGSDVMINVRRWLQGAAESELPLEDYRRYVISHEVGHALGHGHVACPGPAEVAPVMMQQTKGLDGCLANPWPYPDG